MKHLIRRRIASAATAGLILASSVLSAMPVLADDTYPYVGEAAKGENQPYQHGYRVEDIMDWSPETDPYAELLKAEVPLQNRNEAFTATQADPSLSADPQYLTLTGDYGNAFLTVILTQMSSVHMCSISGSMLTSMRPGTAYRLSAHRKS